jgi:hypothetical protein
MLAPHRLSQGIQGSITRSLLVFSLLLVCSATAKASVIVVWLPVSTQTAEDSEPQSENATSPTIDPGFPVASPSVPPIAAAASAMMRVPPPPTTDAPQGRVGELLDGLYFFRDTQDWSQRKFAVDGPLIVATVMRSAATRAVAWPTAMVRQCIRQSAPLYGTKAIGQRLLGRCRAMGPATLHSLSVQTRQWPDEWWAQLDVTRPIAKIELPLDYWAAIAADTTAGAEQGAEEYDRNPNGDATHPDDLDVSDGEEVGLFLPQHLVEWELNGGLPTDNTETPAMDRPAGNLLRPVLKGTAGILEKMSVILAELSERIEDASGPAAQTARRS